MFHSADISGRLLVVGWTDFLGPAVVAAVISGIVAVTGFFVSNSTATKLHTQKLALDLQLAKDKASADLRLAERKFGYDKALASWLRRSEFAEQVLSDFYQARDAFTAI